MTSSDGQHTEPSVVIEQLLERIAELERLVGAERAVDSALRWCEARHRAVVDSTSWAIVTVTAHGLIESFNRAAEHTFGYHASEVIGQPVTLLIPERLRAAHEAGFHRYLETRIPRIVGHTVRLTGLRRDGVEIAIDLTITAIEHDSDLLFIGLILEISSERQL